MTEHFIWTEKYKPTSLDDFIGNENDFVKRKIGDYIEQGEIPLLLLEGPPGTGKSTIANIICKQLDCEVKKVNASDERGMPLIRNIIEPFLSTGSMKKWKIVWLEEGDKLTPDGQDALKDIMLKYIKKGRFIITCNNKNLLNDALQSRLSTGTFEVKPLNKKDVGRYIFNILKKEDVTFTIDDIGYLVNKTYPDIRKTINVTQQYITKDNRLVLDKSSIMEINLMNSIVQILQNKTNFNKAFTEIRQLIANNSLSIYSPIITYIYEQLDDITKNAIIQSNIILSLNEAQKSDRVVIDKEINIMCMFSELLQTIYEK